MKAFRALSEVPADFGPSVVTIGNFDGVHTGHREILRRVAAIARERGLTPVVLTFDPHPAKVLAPERAPLLITTIGQRLRRMESEGTEVALLLPFSPELARLSPEEFAREVLAETLHARVVIVGEDFRFGYKQAGDMAALTTLVRPSKGAFPSSGDIQNSSGTRPRGSGTSVPPSPYPAPPFSMVAVWRRSSSTAFCCASSMVSADRPRRSTT